MTDVYEIINACAPPIMVTFLYLEKIHPRQEIFELYQIKTKKNSRIWDRDNIL